MAKFLKKGDALFGFLKSRRNKKGEIVFRPMLGRVFLAMACLALVGWLCAALGVSLFVKHARGFEGGRYVDILFYPWRKDAYQEAWGNEFIARGLEMLEDGEVGEGFRLIRIGHVKAPANLEARLLLAEVHAGRRRADLAGKVLRDGLPYAAEENLDYLRTTLRTLLLNQEDAAVREIAGAILIAGAPVNPRNQITALAAASASFYRGIFDEAEDFLTDFELTNHPEGRILLARIDWERGRQQAALDRLERLAERFTEQEEVYIYLSRYYRELGQHSKAHSYAVMRQITNPLTAAPRVALLYSYHANGETERVHREARKILQDFGHDQDGLLGLGEFAAQTGDVDLCRRIFQTADRNGLSLDLIAILLSEAHLKAGEFQEAVWFLESHSSQNPNFAERFGPVLNGVYAVAYLGLGDEDRSDGYLRRLLSVANLRADNFLITSRRMMELGHNRMARQLVEHAHRVDPRNQAALVELIRLDLEIGWTDNLLGNIEKLLATRKPPRELLEESVLRLGADEFLFLPKREQLLHAIDTAIRNSGSEAEPTHS